MADKNKVKMKYIRTLNNEYKGEFLVDMSDDLLKVKIVKLTSSNVDSAREVIVFYVSSALIIAMY